MLNILNKEVEILRKENEILRKENEELRRKNLAIMGDKDAYKLELEKLKGELQEERVNNDSNILKHLYM